MYGYKTLKQLKREAECFICHTVVSKGKFVVYASTLGIVPATFHYCIRCAIKTIEEKIEEEKRFLNELKKHVQTN